MLSANILIVEDEAVSRSTLKGILEAEGYQVYEATNGEEMNKVLVENVIHLIVLDINLPGKNGLMLAREIRAQSTTAMMFLTGRDNEVDKILGLEIGADDYVTKPYNPRELAIRVRNLLSRSMRLSQEVIYSFRDFYRFNGWLLNTHRRVLTSPTGEEFKLPRSEFRMLVQFCENAGKVQSREELLKKMVGREHRPSDRTVDVTIRRLRKYFLTHPATPELIATVHGEGYRFCGDLE